MKCWEIVLDEAGGKNKTVFCYRLPDCKQEFFATARRLGYVCKLSPYWPRDKSFRCPWPWPCECKHIIQSSNIIVTLYLTGRPAEIDNIGHWLSSKGIVKLLQDVSNSFCRQKYSSKISQPSTNRRPRRSYEDNIKRYLWEIVCEDMLVQDSLQRRDLVNMAKTSEGNGNQLGIFFENVLGNGW
jgi:hypothetical protein